MDLSALAARLQTLPPHQQVVAAKALKKLYGDRLTSNRDPKKRAYYATRPADYAEDILGIQLTWNIEGRVYDQALKILDTFLREPFLIVIGGNGLSKSFIMAALALWHHDAVAAQPGPNGKQGGSRTLLLGPTETLVLENMYSKIVARAEEAEARGCGMPPGRQTTRWKSAAEWLMEIITPGVQAGQSVSHRASGRHKDNLLAIFEEAQGVHSGVVQSIIGSASGGGPRCYRDENGVERFMGNSVCAILNADRLDSAIAAEARKSTWRVMHLSALEHPNILERRRIVPGGAVSVDFVDRRVADGCIRLGPFPEVMPDPARTDFVYALPEVLGSEDGGPRADGHPGQEGAPLAVYRPGSLFETRVLGLFPSQDDNALFDKDAWDAAVERWRETPDPDRAPDAIGVDCAREGSDDSVATPRWGLDAVTLLSRWVELTYAKDLAGIASLQGSVRIGRSYTAPKGDGPTVAKAIRAHFGRWSGVPWTVDDGGIGASVYDSAKMLPGVFAYPVSFGAAAPPPVEGQLWPGYLVRDALAVLAASVVNRGWVNIPDCPELRKQALAMWADDEGERIYTVKERDEHGVLVDVKRAVSCRKLVSKDDIRPMIGKNSPDEFDSFCLSLWRLASKPGPGGIVPLGRVASAFRR